MTGRLNQSTVIGGILAVFGAAVIVASFQIKPDPDGSWGARIFPLVGSGAVLLLGALEFIKGLRQTIPRSAGGAKLPGVMWMLVLSVAYIWLMGKFGYLISTGIAAPLALMLFGKRHPPGLIAAAILCPAIYHLIFFAGLGVYPPYGEWFDLLNLIQGY